MAMVGNSLGLGYLCAPGQFTGGLGTAISNAENITAYTGPIASDHSQWMQAALGQRPVLAAESAYSLDDGFGKDWSVRVVLDPEAEQPTARPDSIASMLFDPVVDYFRQLKRHGAAGGYRAVESWFKNVFDIMGVPEGLRGPVLFAAVDLLTESITREKIQEAIIKAVPAVLNMTARQPDVVKYIELLVRSVKLDGRRAEAIETEIADAASAEMERNRINPLSLPQMMWWCYDRLVKFHKIAPANINIALIVSRGNVVRDAMPRHWPTQKGLDVKAICDRFSEYLPEDMASSDVSLFRKHITNHLREKASDFRTDIKRYTYIVGMVDKVNSEAVKVFDDLERLRGEALEPDFVLHHLMVRIVHGADTLYHNCVFVRILPFFKLLGPWLEERKIPESEWEGLFAKALGDSNPAIFDAERWKMRMEKVLAGEELPKLESRPRATDGRGRALGRLPTELSDADLQLFVKAVDDHVKARPEVYPENCVGLVFLKQRIDRLLANLRFAEQYIAEERRLVDRPKLLHELVVFINENSRKIKESDVDAMLARIDAA